MNAARGRLPGRCASCEDTLQAMLREIEEDEGLQALSEEVGSKAVCTGTGPKWLQFSAAGLRLQPDSGSLAFRLFEHQAAL